MNNEVITQHLNVRDFDVFFDYFVSNHAKKNKYIKQCVSVLQRVFLFLFHVCSAVCRTKYIYQCFHCLCVVSVNLMSWCAVAAAAAALLFHRRRRRWLAHPSQYTNVWISTYINIEICARYTQRHTFYAVKFDSAVRCLREWRQIPKLISHRKHTQLTPFIRINRHDTNEQAQKQKQKRTTIFHIFKI